MRCGDDVMHDWVTGIHQPVRVAGVHASHLHTINAISRVTCCVANDRSQVSLENTPGMVAITECTVAMPDRCRGRLCDVETTVQNGRILLDGDP